MAIKVRFLQDYRGVLSGEFFYSKDQVVSVDDYPMVLNIEGLSADGRIEIIEGMEAEPVLEVEIIETSEPEAVPPDELEPEVKPKRKPKAKE